MQSHFFLKLNRMATIIFMEWNKEIRLLLPIENCRRTNESFVNLGAYKNLRELIMRHYGSEHRLYHHITP